MQAGGHKNNIQFDGNTIFKTTKPGELQFYQQLYQSDDQQLKQMLPKYYGSVDDKIILENLNSDKKVPSMVDIKMGR